MISRTEMGVASLLLAIVTAGITWRGLRTGVIAMHGAAASRRDRPELFWVFLVLVLLTGLVAIVGAITFLLP